MKSVTEYATEHGVTRQAVLERLQRGTLPGERVGETWIVHGPAVQKCVRLVGCDDSTGFLMAVTEVEAAFLERLSIESYRRGGGCRPILIAVDDPPTDRDGEVYGLDEVWRDDDPDDRRRW